MAVVISTFNNLEMSETSKSKNVPSALSGYSSHFPGYYKTTPVNNRSLQTGSRCHTLFIEIIHDFTSAKVQNVVFDYLKFDAEI